jgi:hypothetical protein
MSTVFSSPTPAPQPDPDRTEEPASGARRFAGFLRRVINCGKQLVIAVRLRAHRPDFPRFARPFSTNYLPHILRRIHAAIHRAIMLEERALQQDGLRPQPRDRVRTPSASPGKTRDEALAVRSDNALPAPQRTERPARPSGDPHYADWPSTKQLAAELRRRPIAAVLVDICRDLGITPHHPLWQEMCHVIAAHGGSVEALEQGADERWCSKRWLETPFTPRPLSTLVLWPAPWSHPVTPPPPPARPE